ncbi:hypothetical protein N3K66_008071 [Trichothecium roseum]|uniref:Uncharacterized protein n=1 Tax=Trichothecium roseum TaxID=47278 RepID=A0ACC0USC5_9HYPO|nr:hypothetical protein N3K66_008071 [Trichothecium roseum]
MSDPDRSVLVLYGSETGNAQDMAEELGRLCQRLHFRNHIDALDAIDLNTLLQYELVIFVISTTGQGDMPHNSLAFWKKLLRKKLSPGCLGDVKYTCFGLGDSTYLKFNWAARKLIRRLDQLGATAFIEGYEADEQFPDGVEGCFANWSERLYQHLLEHYPPPAGLIPVPEDAILPARWSLAPAMDALSKHTNGVASSPTLTDIELPPSRLLPIPDGWNAHLVDSKRTTPETHWQDVRLVSFDVPCRETGQRLMVDPGDCLTIYPKNFPQDVQKLITLMGWEDIADEPLNLSLCASLPRDLHAPSPSTLRDLLLENIDITSIPRRSFLKNMSYYSTNPDHKERLLEFTKTEFLDEYFDYATRSRRTIIEALEEFTSVKLPADRLLDVFPLIRGRDFSIANGGARLAHPSGDPAVTRVELLIAMVRYRTILRKPRQGLCSRYLASLPPGTPLRVGYKPVLSPIHGAQNASRPLVAMATGTGVAPVRALIQERLTHPAPAPTELFFGNRNRAADFFFAEEWTALETAGKLALRTAFSRDQADKVYVQHLIRQEAAELGALIPRQAIFSVCGGSSKMADACKEAVFEPFKEAARNDDEKKERERLLDEVTWWQEIW